MIHKESLLNECIQDSRLKDPSKVPLHPAEYQQQFCVYCRNPYCEHARWAVDKFSARIAAQPDRFFNPIQQDPNNPQFRHLVDFTELTREALRIYMAAQDDWGVEVPVTDGVDKTAPKGVTNSVDDAARILASANNRDLKIPSPEESPEGKTFPPIPEEEPIQEEPIPESTQAPETITPPVSLQKNAPNTLGNTDNPKSGIMIGGDSKPLAEPDDPWGAPSPNKEKKVEPGAKIIMGGGKK